MIIRPEFYDICDFKEGLAGVQVGGKWGYINKEGNMVIKPQFDSAVPFSEGLAVVGLYQ
jgi:hypothetical protein